MKPVPGASETQSPQPLRTVAQIRALPLSETAKSLPVELHALLTYYEPGDGLVFAQDGTGAIYVAPPPHSPALQAGDVVTIIGTTTSGYAANVVATQIKLERAGEFPRAVPVAWPELIRGSVDCRFVSVIGTVRSATIQFAAPRPDPVSGSSQRRPYLLIDLETDGGSVRVHIEDIQGIDPIRLLDARVRLSGVAGGLFDGKQQDIGAQLWLSSARHMEVLETATSSASELPLTDISRIMSGYSVRDRSQRVHVRGSVTLYQPGVRMVLENAEGKAALVYTYQQSPLHINQVVDAVGFPYPHEYSEVIHQGNVLITPQTSPIQPVPIQWEQALAGHFPFGLVSMEGKLTAEVHEPQQDTLVIQAGPHVFSATLPRSVLDGSSDETHLPDYRTGSTVRIAGVCFVHSGGAWNREQWFDLQLRSADDIVVLAAPSWWTVRHLLYLSAALVSLMMGALFWAVGLQRKVRKQTEQIRLTMESESARERRIAFLEKERGRVLEAINSMLSTDEVLLMILRLISTQLEDRACWCELSDGTTVGHAVCGPDAEPCERRGIYSGAGERLGSLLVAGADPCQEQVGEALEMGASLVALAIDNRRLYETLIHRSQFDQLTNAANRFLLESRLDETLAHAERSQKHFALVYIDLDHFKQVNDLYGHRVGDVYLQQVAERFSQKLRGMDTLARVGGDEFIALIPVVRNRAEVEEITHRLARCFDSPFAIDDFTITGAASIGIAMYPEDGCTKDELKRVADAAMYAQKPGVAIL